jgi:acetolactate synthase-1/2/3 large subunit
MFKKFKIGPMFGMGGFQLLPFYDAARRIGLEHYLINDERCGAFAADAYAKVTGRIGFCDATLGPGATNLVTALVESLNAGIPLIALTGDSHRLFASKNMTQEARQVDILKPAVKEVIRVEMIERIPELVRRAFIVATTGKPGPVVIDLPEDICHDSYRFSDQDFEIDAKYKSVPSIRVRPTSDGINLAAEILISAERPMIFAGGGVHLSSASSVLTKFAEENNIPVAHTLSGKGAIPCIHRLSAGLFGRYDRIANGLMDDADVLLFIGCKLGEIATKRYELPKKGKKIIHLDIVPEEIGRTIIPTLGLWGDAFEGIKDLERVLEGRKLNNKFIGWAKEVEKRMTRWKAGIKKQIKSDEIPINIARVIYELNYYLPSNAILVADGGFAAHWSGLLYDTKQAGRGFVPDRGFASIGYGVPGAIGATLGARDNNFGPVVALTGDAGFNMVMGELETARRLGISFTVIVFNNSASGYVKALQHLMYGKDTYQSSDLAETDYAKTANAFGCKGIRVERPGQIAKAIKKSLNEKKIPVVIDVLVTKDPAKMLPGVDNRTVKLKKGDRIA